MRLGSIVAIYFLFWVASAFVLLSVGVRTDQEAGTPLVRGQAESAPHSFDLARHLRRSALVALVLFGLYYANWTFGWIGADALDFYNR